MPEREIECYSCHKINLVEITEDSEYFICSFCGVENTIEFESLEEIEAEQLKMKGEILTTIKEKVEKIGEDSTGIEESKNKEFEKYLVEFKKENQALNDKLKVEIAKIEQLQAKLMEKIERYDDMMDELIEKQMEYNKIVNEMNAESHKLNLQIQEWNRMHGG